MPVSRRKFLTDSASAVVGSGLVLARANASPSRIFSVRGPSKKIIVLGAGMAGLVAGYELTQLGHDITILEARARPGGRVHTLREPFSDGLFAEEGAARIPTHHDLTLKYVNLLQLPLEPMYPSGLSALRFDGGRREVPIENFTEGLGQYFGPELGGDPKKWFKIKGGTDVLPHALAAKLPGKIHYESPVIRIEQDETSARAVFRHKGTHQTLSADRILSTIPFSVLQNVDLPSNFSERKRGIIKNTNYDAVARVYLQLKNRGWENKGFSGFALTDTAVEVWHPTWNQPGPRGILMTYARPGEAERITSMKEPDRISSTVSLLDSMFTGVRSSFELGATKCWLQDEWAKGAWAFVGLRDFLAAQSAEGRVHFAGEHLSPFFSWMQGAISSALKVVKEIEAAPESIKAAA